MSTFGKIMFKKYTAVVILALLAFHLAGSYVYFIVRLGEVRMTMREKLAELPDEALDVVVIPRPAFRSDWLAEREMKWEGKMYDIARVEWSATTVRVFCLHDKDEDGLLNFLSAIVETSRQDTRQTPAAVIQFTSLKYVVLSMNLPVCPVRDIVVGETGYPNLEPSFISDPLSPPPRG